MNRKATNLLVVLVLTFSMTLLACAKTRGNAEGETAIWAGVTARSSGSMASNSLTQYYLALQTDPPGIASPTGEGWFDAGTNATV